jgi:D-threonate/D-erythronate kinase
MVLVIIADDLTGALDTAAPFAARGLHVQVALTPAALGVALAQSPDVLSINLASREKSADEALRLVRCVVDLLPPEARLFKKVDSRLKGHVEVELDGIPYQRALVAPAIPAFGRIVQDGHVRGFGVEVPLSIRDVLGRHSIRSTVPDAGTGEDVARALEEAESDGLDLLVGARGLAEALAVRMTGQVEAPLVAMPSGTGLFVIGSHDQITLRQVEQLRALNGASYRPAPNGELGRADDDEPSPLVLVQAIPGEDQVSPEEVALNLAASVHPRLTSKVRTMLLCGGATAEAVLARMGIECFRLEGECMPGLGLAHAKGQCIIAKSGGFGQPDTLAKLAEQLHGGRG